MASTLYILLPSKSVASALPDWATLARPFALVADDGAIVQQGQQTLTELKSLVANVRQVSLLLAASDVSLMLVKVPPMSAAKLKMALPNLLEDQLLSDPSDLILHSTLMGDSQCMIAAVDRSWMESLHDHMQMLQAKKLTAYVISMTMRSAPDMTSVLITPESEVVELAFCPAGQLGFGLTLPNSATPDSPADTAREVLQSLDIFSAGANMTVLLPADQLPVYRQVAEMLAPGIASETKIEFQAIDWPARLAGLDSASVDLMSSVSHANQSSFDWARWRWPLVLAGAVLLVNLAGINIQWLSMKREARALGDAVTQAYRASFPKDTVILDPMAQMQQKINLSRKMAGQSTPEDFLVLAAQFGQTWDALFAGKQGAAAVSSMEYRERSLFVKIKASGLLPVEQLKKSLQEHSLELVSSTDGVLQVRAGRGAGK